MLRPSWLSFLRPASQRASCERHSVRRRSTQRQGFRPALEPLEGRMLPSNYTAATVSDLIAAVNAANAAGGSNTITLIAGTTFTLTGWSLQYASATGTTWTNNQPLGGTIAPGEYYLVQLASGGAVGQPLPVQANIIGSINMSATTDRVEMVVLAPSRVEARAARKSASRALTVRTGVGSRRAARGGPRRGTQSRGRSVDRRRRRKLVG